MPDPAEPHAPTFVVPAEYRSLQTRLATGWNTWDTRSVLSHVHLPDGLVVSLGIKEYYRGTCLRSAQIGRRGEGAEAVQLGPHAVDGSSTEVIVRWSDVELLVRSAHDGDDLVLLIEPLANQAKAAALTVSVAFAWGLPGSVRHEGMSITADSGDVRTDVFATVPHTPDPYTGIDGPHFVLPTDGSIGVSTGHHRELAEIREIIARGRATLDENAGSEHSAIVRDAIAWNTIYEPSHRRVVTTVSRLWNVGKRGGYAMFCWDAFFGALLAGTVSRDLAYANVVEMLAEVTPEGFVPNVAQGTGRRTFDGSQPPFASIIAWELHAVHGGDWFLPAVFPVLLSWNRWWWRVRRDGDLLSLGSTWFESEAPSPQDIPRIHQHFGATCESGADDHPVFSDVPFDETTGRLRAHDIGLNSEFVLDCEYLARIADAIGADAEASEVRQRGTLVADGIRDRLWDPAARIFRSHFSDTGAPTAHLSPMSFFPMFAGIGDATQVRDMVELHLRNDAEFGGAWVIPSSPRDDARTAKQSYWSGRAWPPINFLVYLGLLRVGRTADSAWLAAHSEALVLKEWRACRHIHENYSSESGDGCDVANSEPFLTWGALLSLVAMIQTSEVPFFSDWKGGTRAPSSTDTSRPSMEPVQMQGRRPTPS
ncbi:MGH1-like glycoside hydrolase domain-containing protein [Agromyces laixinhei]|uniref:MGH1-like glycoside hydrolase domain-containing protein n=1 Tax=Agromyces laixinhei TaxID=2585717 RepID=UPI0018DB7110|nr:trehalase family glycosidase [Agromyces laixinhei]